MQPSGLARRPLTAGASPPKGASQPKPFVERVPQSNPRQDSSCQFQKRGFPAAVPNGSSLYIPHQSPTILLHQVLERLNRKYGNFRAGTFAGELVPDENPGSDPCPTPNTPSCRYPSVTSPFATMASATRRRVVSLARLAQHSAATS